MELLSDFAEICLYIRNKTLQHDMVDVPPFIQDEIAISLISWGKEEC